MSCVTYVEEQLKRVVVEIRPNGRARQMDCIVQHSKFTGAAFVQTLSFGFQLHVQTSLEQLTSMLQLLAVSLTDSTKAKRFIEACVEFCHAILQWMRTVVLQVGKLLLLNVLNRFRVVICEDSSKIPLSNELVDL